MELTEMSADPTEYVSELPHHWSWFSLLPESWSDWSHSMGAPFNDTGERWFFGGHVDVLHVWALAAVVLLLGLIGVSVRGHFQDTKNSIVPSDRLDTSTFIELFVGAVFNMMAGMMGNKAAKYFLPLIGTCAFVIFFSNVLGLVPGFLPPTENLNTTAVMAIIIFLATHIYGIREQGLGPYLKHFCGPVLVLAPLIFCIELVSHLVRPLTLCVRLTANMFADHALLVAFLGFLLGTWLWFLPVAIPAYLLGCMVVTIQTVVFCLLSTVYISMAIEHQDH